jgi:hypothetical protein
MDGKHGKVQVASATHQMLYNWGSTEGAEKALL